MSETTGRLSIREIARRIDIPESTLRYYRNVFTPYIPTIGAGRSRRHPEEAIEVFTAIARFFAAGESRETIRARLESARPDQAGQLQWSEVSRPSSGQLRLEISDMEAVERVEAGGRLRTREVEHLITAMMVRDRELTEMHRDLLQIVSRLIQALEARAVLVQPPPSPASSSPPAAFAPEAGSNEKLQELRQSLEGERETVERLRVAKLELERRLTKLEREQKSGRR